MEPVKESKTERSTNTKLFDARMSEMTAREEILEHLRVLSLGARATKIYCNKSLGYTPAETRQVLTQLGLIVTGEHMTSQDPAIRMKIEKLQTWRRVRSRVEGVPAYRVLTNRVLLAVASESPKTTEKLQDLKGFGRKSAAVYGSEILALLRE